MGVTSGLAQFSGTSRPRVLGYTLFGAAELPALWGCTEQYLSVSWGLQSLSYNLHL